LYENRGLREFDETRLGEYAEGFVQSARAAQQDFRKAYGEYRFEDLKGIQYALNTLATDGLVVGIYPYPATIPHAFVKLATGAWKEASV
jgi:hypothetical protein